MYYVRTTNGSMLAITPRSTAVVAVNKTAASNRPITNTRKTTKKR